MKLTLRIPVNILVALAAATCMATADHVMAAGTDAGAKPVDQLQELDEIWVHGRSLSRRIEDAEDKLFKRFNRINRQHEYDVVCGTISLEPGSMIMKRVCAPAFLADFGPASGAGSFGYPYGYAGSYDYATYGQACIGNGGMIPQQDMNGDMYWVASGCPMNYTMRSAWPSRIGLPSPPQVLTDEKRAAYKKNFLKTVLTDTRLLDMSAQLKGLYAEMDEVQARYASARAEARERRKLERQSLKPVTGPRGL